MWCLMLTLSLVLQYVYICCDLVSRHYSYSFGWWLSWCKSQPRNHQITQYIPNLHGLSFIINLQPVSCVLCHRAGDLIIISIPDILWSADTSPTSRSHTSLRTSSTRTERMWMWRWSSCTGVVKHYFRRDYFLWKIRADPDLEFEGLLKRQHTRVKYFQGSLMCSLDLERVKVTRSINRVCFLNASRSCSEKCTNSK